MTRMRIPLMSSTLTTVLAFIPMVLLPGAGGDFLGSIAVAVVAMLVSSFVLAVAVTRFWRLDGYLQVSRLSGDGGAQAPTTKN
ncbi:MAG: hypothetical protein CM15mP103_12090 [Gammaproteobacteria bacterium]|nr:MAG: hypothetical protein CM15mP103_12090 [Gammaproteobacteria bacterium]